MGERSLFSVLDSTENSSKIKWFKIPAGGKARVRFLYDDPSEMTSSYVHVFMNPFARIACVGKYNNCKWCLQGAQARTFSPVPIFNLDTNEIQYWDRTQKYLVDNIYPLIKPLFDQNMSAAGQVFEISRIGSEMKNTKYIFTAIGEPDGQTKEVFGTVEDQYDSGMIKEADFDYQPAANQQNNYNQNYNNQNYNQGFNQGFNQVSTQPYNQGFNNVQGPIGSPANTGYNTTSVPPATRRSVAFD